jgi:hypothetical protein
MNRTKAALQDGIYFRHGERPPAFFMLLLLARKGDPSSVNEQLANLWEVYAGLKEGRVRDLPGVRVPDGNLGVLLGFGSKATLRAEFEMPGLLPPGYSDALPPRPCADAAGGGARGRAAGPRRGCRPSSSASPTGGLAFPGPCQLVPDADRAVLEVDLEPA